MWKPIHGYEKYYSISNLGRVRGEHRIIQTSRAGELRGIDPKILTPFVSHGRMEINLSRDGHCKRFGVGRLVYEAFNDVELGNSVISYRDGDFHNVSLSNLFITTYDEVSARPHQRYVRPVRCITTNTQFKSITEASHELNQSCSSIIRSCKHNVPTRSGLLFSYVE